jgi:hypothetical protein
MATRSRSRSFGAIGAPHRSRPHQATTLPAGPFLGMNDAPQPNASRDDEALLLQNLYGEDTELGPRTVGRPGFAPMGTQLGAGGVRRGQGIVQFTKRTGTEYTVAIAGGKFYTFDWGADLWTEVLSAANLAGAAITLSTTARCYFVTFADKLIISDGVNTPWAWDGTTGAGLTKLTNAPVLYGQPVVYYAKLFAIKNTARQTIVWSEEGDPNLGYEAGGYNNAWDLVQTQTEGLVALGATNEALYFARANSVGAITGAVTTDFKTTGTREAVSVGLGTRSPGAFLVYDNAVVFPDQFGQFQLAQVGRGLTEVGLGIRSTMAAASPAKFPDILAIDDADADLIRFAVATSGSDDPNLVVNLHRDGLRVAGLDRGYAMTAIAMVKNAGGYPTRVHLGGGTPTASADGYAYYHGTQVGALWNDGLAGGSQPINHQIETRHLGYDTTVDKVWERFDLGVLLPTSLTNLTATLTTPREAGATVVLATISGGGSLWDVAVWDTGEWATVAEERHIHLGSRRLGRWCRLRLAHAQSSERMALLGITARVRPIDDRPVKH